MAEADFNSNFNAWFTGGITAGQIEPNTDRAMFMAKFAAAQLEKAVEAVREAKEAEGHGLTLQQEKAQYHWEVRLEKREDRASRGLNEQGHLIATIDGIDLGLLRS